MRYYVDCHASSQGDGSKEAPFSTIQQAADLAQPGDEVYVLPGVYREAVHPMHKGREDAPIVYRSAVPLKAVIKGSEAVKNWEPLRDHVWTVHIPNRSFPERNPFTTRVSGDWFIASFVAHPGAVFLNGKSMYEVTELSQVFAPVVSKASWDPDFSVYTWFSRQDAQTDETVLYANFQGYDPNAENVEISVRPSCFFPLTEGIDYITLSGFTVTQAATQWAPPTAFQEGMIGPNWAKGWVIENCDISESKCSGISLGKYYQPENDNKWLKTKYKDGTQTERECICQAQREGWTKERIGHHVVRNCHIHDCGQTGIVGHLGGVFSVIEDNHIHHINNKQNLAGAEIGGIKMHAAIDVLYRRNHIHHCTRGLWLDWQAQGTRVTQNFFHHNTLPCLEEEQAPGPELFQALGEDVFIEVSHGPTLLDHNIFLSSRAVKLAAQGVAMVHNLVGGSFAAVGIGTDNGAPTVPSPRYTPYHVPHRTEIAGFMTFLHGDNRFYNNIFLQQPVHPALRAIEAVLSSDGNPWDDGCVTVGTHRFDGYPTFDEWDRAFDGYCGMGSPDSDRYYSRLPIWAAGNVYLNGAGHWDAEQDFVIGNHPANLTVAEKNGSWVLSTDLYSCIPEKGCPPITTETLGRAFEPEQPFENADGTPITFDTDYFGAKHAAATRHGPLAQAVGSEGIAVYTDR